MHDEEIDDSEYEFLLDQIEEHLFYEHCLNEYIKKMEATRC